MATEYEATFIQVDKEEMRDQLKSLGATLVYPETLQKRVTFDLPEGYAHKGIWARVRDEGDKITMSVKQIVGDNIEDQKEICLVVDNFEDAVEFLKTIGCVARNYQEAKRELWKLDECEITIDTWPFLEPFVEIEGPSENAVRAVAKKLEFDWKDALFCTSYKLYQLKYSDRVSVTDVPHLTFEMQNPFV